MAKAKVAFVCADCGAEHGKWQGQCTACGQWNTLREFAYQPAKGRATGGYAGSEQRTAKLADIGTAADTRMPSGFGELDRVLGGGFVAGSVVLLGGDPGAGKSTLLLQVSTKLAQAADGPDAARVLYVSGEESLEQIAARARRLRLPGEKLTLASDTVVERIADLVTAERPHLVVIDSIQVMQVQASDSLPGSVSQVRESAAELVRLAKHSGVAIVLVGHITKEGNLAGPKVLEHMVDCLVMLDAPAGSRYRTLRSQKNRFGAVNELGVFAMTEDGMKEVSNPSAIFLERPRDIAPGSVVTVTWEGTRPLLVEIQALVDNVQGGFPRRVAVGLDPQRLAMHLAVMHRHCGVSLADQDVFANVVGGVRIAETGADLALLAATLSSFRASSLPRDLVVFGELGLTGEVRPVANGQDRLREAAKHGFTRAILPRANRPREAIPGTRAFPVASLSEALDVIRDLAETDGPSRSP